MSPALRFNDDVVGEPVASPGLIARKPSAVGATAVTFSSTPVAPTGTAASVTCMFCDTAETNGPGSPMFTGSRVSRMRTGVIVTTDDGNTRGRLHGYQSSCAKGDRNRSPNRRPDADLHKPRR